MKILDRIKYYSIKIDNKEVLCYLVTRKAVELEVKVSQLMNEGKTQEAIKAKNDVVELYHAYLHMSKYGILDMLYVQAQKSLTELTNRGLESCSMKAQGYSSNVAYRALGIAQKCAGSSFAFKSESKGVDDDDDEQDEEQDGTAALFCNY